MDILCILSIEILCQELVYLLAVFSVVNFNQTRSKLSMSSFSRLPETVVVLTLEELLGCSILEISLFFSICGLEVGTILSHVLLITYIYMYYTYQLSSCLKALTHNMIQIGIHCKSFKHTCVVGGFC